MAEGIDPSEAARLAQGASEDVSSDVDPMPDADSGRSGSGVFDVLMQTEPNDPLEQIESPWRPDVGGPARIMRGIQKMTNIDGMPAIVDIIIGAAEMLVEQSESTAPDRDNDPDNLPVVVDE